MIVNFLKSAVFRHLEETEIYLKTLQDIEGETLKDLMNKDVIKPDSILFRIPVEGTRPLGEVILHMIRSLEYYVRGIVNNQWEALSYNIMEFSTILEIVNLYQGVAKKFETLLEDLSMDKLNEVVIDFSRPATKAELLLEMIEHSIHHRGQLSVYLRLLDVEPPNIKYII